MSDPSSLPTAMRILAALPALAAASAAPAQAGGDPLARYLWRSRVVVASAASPRDPALAAQRRIFAGLGAEGRDRDLVLVEATEATPEGAALRRRFGGDGFRAVLLGKDGGEKLASAQPLGADALFPVIDAMPMRREEMRRGRP